MHPMNFRTGIGHDTHRFVAGRPLILGGEHLDYPLGLLGHSDADVLTHAICDALLGAAGLGDIGELFPDSDPAYENVCSMELLEQTGNLLFRKKFRIINIDAILFAQEPKISPHKIKMKRNLAKALGLHPDRINIKATTTEGLDAIGRKEGMAATAMVLLWREVERMVCKAD
ncbi:2-C-methyl-D-erythritol 2,4-cyclodiphosphate synthase [Desulfobotulus sp. H1]|uniref:2-C-methyl-D-erythritol 2,4-cyclodiphosphate synthase n=1 Tax=Desulfobotulus pelophilus TaxID=2823377 RepID=A0ABT3N925_9BACT|nr:2-C-methyl-D-erythritol 2,4-cyclodiphosphate synthase [Desulfobotulus pelophilus]MCW7753691.1 2-C-methyl-D-erythritol 2,4-cyclodiphosphate synthase [Desulfobotulus pelophilus]